MSEVPTLGVVFQLSSVLAEVNGGRLRVELSIPHAVPFSQVLEQLFATEPTLRPHIVDERNCVREHVLVMHNGTNHRYRDGDFTVEPGDAFVLQQAVSGG